MSLSDIPESTREEPSPWLMEMALDLMEFSSEDEREKLFLLLFGAVLSFGEDIALQCLETVVTTLKEKKATKRPS